MGDEPQLGPALTPLLGSLARAIFFASGCERRRRANDQPEQILQTVRGEDLYAPISEASRDGRGALGPASEGISRIPIGRITVRTPHAGLHIPGGVRHDRKQQPLQLEGPSKTHITRIVEDDIDIAVWDGPRGKAVQLIPYGVADRSCAAPAIFDVERGDRRRVARCFPIACAWLRERVRRRACRTCKRASRRLPPGRPKSTD